MRVPYHAINRFIDFPANSLLDALAGEIFSLLKAQPKLVQGSDTSAFFGALCALFRAGRPIFPVFSRGAGKPRAHRVSTAQTSPGANRAAPCGAALFVVTPLAAQLCQRNCCGFLAEPCKITTLTRAGHGSSSLVNRAAQILPVFDQQAPAAWSLPRRRPGASIVFSSRVQRYQTLRIGPGYWATIGSAVNSRMPSTAIALRAGDRRGPHGSAADWRSPRHARW
jgi:hypothetical protein